MNLCYGYHKYSAIYAAYYAADNSVDYGPGSGLVYGIEDLDVVYDLDYDCLRSCI